MAYDKCIMYSLRMISFYIHLCDVSDLEIFPLNLRSKIAQN